MKEGQKVLFVSHTANFAKFNRAFMQDLRKKGAVVHYASAGEEEVPDCDKHFQIGFARSPFRLLKNWKAYRELKKLFKKGGYDLIHCHTPVGGVLARSAARSLARKPHYDGQDEGTKQPKVIYTAHGFHFYEGAPKSSWMLYYPVEKNLAKDTDCLITINSEDYKLARKKFQAKKVVRLDGVGVDLTKFGPADIAEKERLREKHGLGKGDFVLIYVAELNKNKDQLSLIEALPRLKKEIPKLKVLLVGKGAYEEKLKHKVQRLGLVDTVKFLGYRKDVAELYKMADVGISTSRREGLGLNLIEEMASGLPLIAKDNRGHREVIVSEQIGRLFTDEKGLLEAVLEMYRSPKLRAEIGKHNLGAVKKYSLEIAKERMAEIYREYLRTR